MIRFKFLLIATVIFFLSGFNLHSAKPAPGRWVITKGCSLKVAGSTNINKFNCVIADYSKPDTLTLNSNSQAPIRMSGILQLDVQKFDCHNTVMTKDLRKTLKAKTFPKLIIRFLSLSKYPDMNKDNCVKGAVTIELAGVMKRFDVDYKFIPRAEGAAILIGTRKVNFSDFNIVPPRKIGGMIQTNNELIVEFNLKLKVLQ